jgi:alpha-glucosidase (family GH31 glycosyl hydrolase)
VIRHRPLGSGHAYRIDPDQRWPVVPVAGEPLVLGATTAPDDRHDVVLEVDRGGRIDHVRTERVSTNRGAGAGHGHLAAAAAANGDGRVEWRATLGALRPGERLRYRFSTGSGATRWHHADVASWQSDGGTLSIDGPAELHSRIGREVVRWLVGPEGTVRVRFALRLEQGERVIGFGERFDAVDQRGRALDAVVFEQYKGQGNRSYLPMPFAHVVAADGRSFAFHVRTSRRAHFDVAAAADGRVLVEVAVDPADPALEIALYDGAPAAALRAFLAETGPPVLPPDWVFGPWMSSNEWNTQSRVLAEVDRTTAEEIPASVIVLEAWSDEETFTAFRDAAYEVHADGSPHRLADFSFPVDGAWPDPKGMVDELHRRGLHVLLWQIPLLKARPRPGSQLEADRRALVERGFAVGNADGTPYANHGWWFPRALLPDFTSPEATSWWLEKRRYLVEELGIDGFKTDGGEHAWGDDLRYADGTRGAETNNRFPVLYAAAYHGLMRSAGSDGITFSRAGFTGAAASPCHWAGDEDSTWEAFRASIVAGLTAGACGVFFWGWDIAGFSGPLPSAELYLRAAAMACFCPVMQYHSEFNHHRRPSNDRTPWNVGEQTGDERVVPAYRALAQLRMRLVPYLAAQAAVAVEHGRPLMRALFFDDADDARIWAHPLQYRLGDDLLVCPVVEPGVERASCYLPGGEWLDLWTGEAHLGSREVTVDAPLACIPVFVRAEAAGLRSVLVPTDGEEVAE